LYYKVAFEIFGAKLFVTELLILADELSWKMDLEKYATFQQLQKKV